MPVDSTHALYNERISQWVRCRDAMGGSDAVKSRGTEYLPQLELQSVTDYEAYKKRAMWYGATARTVTGLAGAVTRKDPKFVVPKSMDLHLKDITLSGVPLSVFVKNILNEVLLTGRYGVLVDMPDKESPNARPYWVPYTAEQIKNWRIEIINGVTTLTMVVLCERREVVKPDDLFVAEYDEQYRVLKIEEGIYKQYLYRRVKDEKGVFGWASTEIVPVYRGQPMTSIPFLFFGPTGLEAAPEKPPLLDLIDINYSHYINSADLEHGRHFTALPTPWIAGFPKDTKLAIGSSVAWVATDPNAKAGMLEFTGQGLGGLEKGCEAKERLMAVLGARMLEEQKAGVEAADTVMFRSSGERSALQSLALIVSLGITQVLKWHAMWIGEKNLDTITATLNTDYMAAPLSSADLTALVQAYQANTISYETFYWNLQRGELARPDIEVEEERTLIDTQMATQQLNLGLEPAVIQ